MDKKKLLKKITTGRKIIDSFRNNEIAPENDLDNLFVDNYENTVNEAINLLSEFADLNEKVKFKRDELEIKYEELKGLTRNCKKLMKKSVYKAIVKKGKK